MSDVQESIKSIKDIGGIPITETQKRNTFNYIFRPESDGKTKYQKEYNENYSKNLVEHALFMQMKEDLFKGAKRVATSEAARTLKNKLENKGKRISGRSVDQSDSENSPSLKELSRFFINPI